MNPSIRTAFHLLVVLLAFGAGRACAGVAASLQPTQIELGQSVTLTIQTDREIQQPPDLSALADAFNVVGQSTNTQASIGAGGMVRSTTLSIQLEARKEGVLTIPPLEVAGERTEALTLTVNPARVGSAAAGDPIFLQTEFETTTPYVQQPLRYTVRLFYAVALLNGGVDAPAPPNAALQALGEERQYQQQLNGQTYNVYERNYILLPERSGPLTVPAPIFRGRVRNPGADPFFDRGQNISSSGTEQNLEVRAQPANAPDPWLAAKSARFTRAEVSQQGKVGEALTLDLTLDVDGISASQLPEIELPDLPGASVFPEAPQKQDGVAQGQLQAQLRRRFAIVPGTVGTLRIPELKLAYWNTTTDQLDTAVLPAMDLEIAPGAQRMVPADQPTAPVAADSPDLSAEAGAGAASTGAIWPWQLAVALLSLALLLSLAWGWRRGRISKPASTLSTREPDAAELALAAALARGDLRAIALALARLPGKRSPEQATAVAQLQRSLWSPEAGGGDTAQLLLRLRAAFAQPAAGSRPQQAGSVLPPLYPPRAA